MIDAPARPSGSPAPPACADSHAHLAMAAFADDLPQVLARARAAGITEILTASTTIEDVRRNVEIAAASAAEPGSPRVRAAAGVHPHEAKGWRAGDEERIEALAREGSIVAIGEAGLDYHYMLSPKETQVAVFSRQVRLAARLKLPIVVHCREAAADIAAALDGEGGRECGGVIHCFTEDTAFAQRCLDLGFHISFSGIATFPRAEDLREAARAVPRDRLLVETDAPYLAPVPHRGKRNEPAFAMEVLRAVAEARGDDPAELAAIVLANFRQLFAATD